VGFFRVFPLGEVASTFTKSFINNRKDIAMIQKKGMTVSLSFPLIRTLITSVSHSLPYGLGNRRKGREQY
jgi:hypothetical protein